MYKIVLLRHGESTWNQENRFTGWTDVGLTEKGQAEAVAAGQLLKKEGFAFDIAYTPCARATSRNAPRAWNVLWVQIMATRSAP